MCVLKKDMKFKPLILTFSSDMPIKELRWKGQLLIPGIFDGEHYLIFETLDGNKTRLSHGEKFSGCLTMT